MSLNRHMLPRLPRPARLAAAISLVLLSATALLRAQVQISEFMATNSSSPYVDENNDHEDWLELFNSGASAVALNGWYLTDDATDLRKWQFPVTTPAVSLAPGARLVVWCSNKNRKTNAARLHTNFKLASEGEYLALVRPDGLTVEFQYNNFVQTNGKLTYPPQPTDVSYGISGGTQWQTLVGPSPTATSYSLGIRARVPLSAADMAGWNQRVYTETGTTWYDRTIGLDAGYYKGIGFDTGSGLNYLIHPSGNVRYFPSTTTPWMNTINGTIQLRIPFTVANASQVQALQMKLRWEDGYTAYLNGVKISEANAPASPVYNSNATADRLDGECEDVDVITLAGAQANLVTGANVLAIQALNNSAANSIFLITPTLEARVPGGGTPGQLGYLQAATPGAENAVASTVVGPIITATTKAPAQPAAASATPLTITTKVRAALNPVGAVTLFYRTMYNAESSLAMFDDGPAGAHGDALAADGIYTAQIPITTLAAGQMLRWRVQATDTLANKSTDPAYTDPIDNDQYFGTVALDPSLANSQLPALHWFVASADDGNTRSKTGARCSFFFRVQKADLTWENNFYDNVWVRLHGQSTANFPGNKKSHNIGFNKDNRFEWSNAEERVKGLNLLTNYADKSKVRNTATWETWNKAGQPSHWSMPVRVQKNGVFWGMFDLVEDAHEQFLDRVGLDSQGALYKVYNSLENVSQSVGGGNGVEKKTREYEDFSDLAALETGLNPANALSARRTYLYDNVSIPRLVNQLAISTLLLSNDYAHKNYYMYRDTLGTGEWSMLPWDQDLTLGHTWVSGPGYFDDDIDSQAGLVLGATATNRLTGLICSNDPATSSAELVQMYLRRLRTLMDQFLVSSVATDGPLEQRINQVLNKLDPPAAAFLTDADLDFQTWGYWNDGSSTTVSGAGLDAATHVQGLRQQALRILSSNPNPPYPSANPNTNLSRSTIPAFLPGRRAILYGGTLSLLSQTIPAAQSTSPTVSIESIDFNPASGTQDQEYFIIKNTSGSSLDVSGWKLTGAVEYTFPGGTVIPPYTTGVENIGLLHVARNPAKFRARTTGPKGGQMRLVVGPYQGQLSARGETITLSRPISPLDPATLFAPVATQSYAGTPTATQGALRVTELNFHPVDPTPAELAALPGVTASDFEYIELINTGATTLNLAGAYFDKGVTFVFPAGYTLAAGQRCLVVAHVAAFNLRYGAVGNVAGAFEGSLDNGGETIQLLDVTGEEVLEFSYKDSWYPPADGGGYSLVVRAANPAFDAYGSATSWALSGAPGGSPGADDAGGFSQVFEGWRNGLFSVEELAAGVITTLTADPDGDGDNNFCEYAFGTNPRVSDVRGMVATSLVDDGGTKYAAVTFSRRKMAIDVTYAVEVNSALANPAGWTAATVLVGAPVDLGNGMERVTVRDSVAAGAAGRYFRVRATK